MQPSLGFALFSEHIWDTEHRIPLYKMKHIKGDLKFIVKEKWKVRFFFTKKCRRQILLQNFKIKINKTVGFIIFFYYVCIYHIYI